MSPPFRVIAIAGSRGYPRRDVVEAAVARLCDKGGDTIALCSGGCHDSPDVWAEAVARHDGTHFIRIDALWDARGRSAGFDRNYWMFHVSDSLLAFWDGTSNGTRHTIELFRNARKQVRVFGPDGRRITDAKLPGPPPSSWRLIPRDCRDASALFFHWRDMPHPWSDLAGFIQNSGITVDTAAFTAAYADLGGKEAAPLAVRTLAGDTMSYLLRLPEAPPPTGPFHAR